MSYDNYSRCYCIFTENTPIRPKRPTFTSRELMKDPSFRKKTMRDLHRRISAAVTQYHQKTPFEMKTTWESYFGLTELTLSPALEIDESQLEENSTVNSLIDKYQETDNEIVNSLIKSVKIQEESSSLMKQILKDIRVLRAILREPDENSSDM
ncbi:16210_t:CDS:2 [Cetraspora pellucida]|uniref:16210_t:CDS:1 n=1 Tax=Cetraspora pellucida TaxID=1433469 RepID=A0A9N9DWN3_9GLOM|nr:16210_t:CDS:2 [Cetraspora pellucida]